MDRFIKTRELPNLNKEILSLFLSAYNIGRLMSDKKQDSNSKDQGQKGLNFSFQDILGDEQGNTSSPQFQSIVQTFRNQDNQSASYNNLPPELQHLFDLPESSYASTNAQTWNRPQSNSSTPNASYSTPPVVQESASSSPMNSNNSNSTLPATQAAVKPSPQTASPSLSAATGAASAQTTPQATPTPTATSAHPSPQASPPVNTQSPATNQPSPHPVKASPSPSQPASGAATPIAVQSPQQPVQVRSLPVAPQPSPKAIAPQQQQPLQPANAAGAATASAPAAAAAATTQPSSGGKPPLSMHAENTEYLPLFTLQRHP